MSVKRLEAFCSRGKISNTAGIDRKLLLYNSLWLWIFWPNEEKRSYLEEKGNVSKDSTWSKVKLLQFNAEHDSLRIENRATFIIAIIRHYNMRKQSHCGPDGHAEIQRHSQFFANHDICINWVILFQSSNIIGRKTKISSLKERIK